MLRLIEQIYTKKKWMPTLQTGAAQSSADGKLIIKTGKTSKNFNVFVPTFFCSANSATQFYQVKETALVGGETVNYQTNALGEVDLSRNRTDRQRPRPPKNVELY